MKERRHPTGALSHHYHQTAILESSNWFIPLPCQELGPPARASWLR